MKIALDCMGGDNPTLPRNVLGAVEAFRENGAEVVLVGNRPGIESELAAAGEEGGAFEIVHTDESVGMEESPSYALRKKRNSSLWKVFSMLGEGEVSAAVTAGNTGAAMAMARAQLGMLPSVEKPAIAVPLPTPAGAAILLDAGANVDCKPKHLLQFALMGSIYSKKICGVASPRVGVLSIGAEQSKGNELTRGAYKLLEASPLPFHGNIEGGDIFSGRVEVIVCDGFVGNIVLKSTEGFAGILEKLLLSELVRDWRGKLGSLLVRPGYLRFKNKISTVGYGGAPLLGINGVCIISHGSSTPAEIKSAIFTARDFAGADINADIEKSCGSAGGDDNKDEGSEKR